MITFKQFLAEDTENLVDFLRKNCAEAVNDMFASDIYLWRGSEKTPDKKFQYDGEVIEGFFGQPRTDRAPRNTPRWAHDFFNEYFIDKFGEPLRSNSVFCYASRVSTQNYGREFALIPIGSYKIYWSPTINDLTVKAFPDVDDDSKPNLELLAGGRFYWRQQKIENVTRDMEKKYLQDVLQKADYRESKIYKNLNVYNELMVKCEKYLMLDITRRQLTELVAAAATQENVVKP